MSGRSTGLTTTNRRPSYESHSVRAPCTGASPSLTLRLLPAGMRYHAEHGRETLRCRRHSSLGKGTGMLQSRAGTMGPIVVTVKDAADSSRRAGGAAAARMVLSRPVGAPYACC